MTIEDDYGMVDGIINNGSKEQPEVKPKAPDLAALFEAARKVAQDEKPAPERSKILPFWRCSMRPRRPEAKRAQFVYRQKAQKGI